MEKSIFYLSILLHLSLLPLCFPELSSDYYRKTCPRFEKIVLDAVTDKYITTPTVAAGALRLFLHDCFVEGCDASVLVTSTRFIAAERDADINHSLSGDAFDVIIRAKAALELACPNVVSCADILAVAARDLVFLVGGPHYSILHGRKDGVISKASLVPGKLPESSMPIPQIVSIFESNGFSIQEMVALSGAHTIGFSHCSEFSRSIYETHSPTYNPRFAEELRSACRDYKSNPTLAVFNDLMTPSKFDNVYFKNLGEGLGVLPSDHGLHLDLRSRRFVQMYATNQTLFFHDFRLAMEKLSSLRVKTGLHGEIRRRCDQINGPDY